MKSDPVDAAPWVALWVIILLLVARRWRRLQAADSAIIREFGLEALDDMERWEPSDFEDERLVPESQ